MALIACASAAHAESQMTVEATSDYDFRGDTQTQEQSAVQVSFDFSDDARWKTGLFMSNVDFGDTCRCENPRLELSPYAEVMHKTDLGVILGAGANYYAYMVNGGGAYDYAEFYVDADVHGIKTALYFAPDYDGRATQFELGAWYVSADGTTTLQGDLSLIEHIGFAWGPYWTRLGGGSKIDYSLGLGYPIGRFEIMLQYIDTKRTESEPGAVRLSGRTILSIETVLPWSSGSP
jgi:uncharacterized protein (TIGR02001 family)